MVQELKLYFLKVFEYDIIMYQSTNLMRNFNEREYYFS